MSSPSSILDAFAALELDAVSCGLLNRKETLTDLSLARHLLVQNASPEDVKSRFKVGREIIRVVRSLNST